MRVILSGAVGWAIIVCARVVTAVRGLWIGIEPSARQRVYFANHVSHGDFVLIWTALPARFRSLTRPVAASDYWASSPLRRFIAHDVFRAVLIDRKAGPAETETLNPIDVMSQALDGDDSLILFPEGTRNTGREPLMPFKSGLYRLGLAHPDIELVPVWIENLNRVLPKGEIVPIPIVCTVTFGAALKINEGETKDVFLARARAALLGLRPTESQT